ncbi:hypothetical protein Pmani_014535 [Petrolisthes manimaculis]|uniref:Uncharacterized protein n=1 Tax=Petrolisthes manimaculis TaxID=1843537 RepID=A0AAE1UD18_9EUCA|nr:hypothetical protein Pmani_014535 [Petrolisthes manimaculis]
MLFSLLQPALFPASTCPALSPASGSTSRPALSPASRSYFTSLLVSSLLSKLLASPFVTSLLFLHLFRVCLFPSSISACSQLFHLRLSSLLSSTLTSSSVFASHLLFHLRLSPPLPSSPLTSSSVFASHLLFHLRLSPPLPSWPLPLLFQLRDLLITSLREIDPNGSRQTFNYLGNLGAIYLETHVPSALICFILHTFQPIWEALSFPLSSPQGTSQPILEDPVSMNKSPDFSDGYFSGVF